MNKQEYGNYVNILEDELKPALGCTEPIALAFASATARDVLGVMPTAIEVLCSGNIVKNVKGVAVPNAGGLKGIETAVLLATVGGNAKAELEVLESITAEDLAKTRELLKSNICSVEIAENVENLYIKVTAKAGESSASVEIAHTHTNITEITKDGKTIMEGNKSIVTKTKGDKSKMTFEGVLEFVESLDVEDIRELISRQVEYNSAISKEGMDHEYGAQVGKTLRKVYGDSLEVRARAAAAAGSDARMGGCSMPVVINSGSGNQGLTVALPIIEYATELKTSEKELYKALVLGNLISIYQKSKIGNLSAFCGAVTAATGAGAAITYLNGGTEENIANTIINSLANTGGIICDGAKASCAAKISSALDGAITAFNMSMEGIRFEEGEGIVQADAEGTIKAIGHVGKEGMAATDAEILKIMIGQVDLEK